MTECILRGKMEILTSRQNELIKSAAALKDAAQRRKTGLFIVEGARLCSDAALNGNEIKSFFVTEKAAQKYPTEFSAVKNAAEKSFFISDSVAEKLSDTKNSQGFFAVCGEKSFDGEIKSDGLYVFTDNVQNPDNLGAVARTSEAFGVDGIIVNSGCDIYSPKAQRAAMGALMRLPVIKTQEPEALLNSLKEKGMRIYASVIDKNAEHVNEADKSGGGIIVIGNEGNGVSPEIIKLCTHKVTIPMRGRSQSLNAAAAASVLIWEFTKDR